MRLHEHPDFDQAILRAADHFRTRGLRAAFIEKDYYVTEALRVIANVAPKRARADGRSAPMRGTTTTFTGSPCNRKYRPC